MSRHAAKHAPRGGVDARPLAASSWRRVCPIREIAAELGVEPRRPCAIGSHATGSRHAARNTCAVASRASRRSCVCANAAARLDRRIVRSARTAVTGARLLRRGGSRASAARQGDPGRGGRRRAASLCGYDAVPRRAAVPPRRSGDEVASPRRATGVTRSLDRLREEATKCVLLCANCHAEVEAGVTRLPVPARHDSSVGSARRRSGVAQSAEQTAVNRRVVGSSPTPGAATDARSERASRRPGVDREVSAQATARASSSFTNASLPSM